MQKETRAARHDQHLQLLDKLSMSGQLDLSANLSQEVGNADAWRMVKELRDQLEKQKEEAEKQKQEAEKQKEEAARKEIETKKLLEEAKRKEKETKRKEEELRKKEEAIVSLQNIDLLSVLETVRTLSAASAERLQRLETDVTLIKENFSKYDLKKETYIWEWLRGSQIVSRK